VTDAVALAIPSASERWHMRASTISETAEKLSQIWSGVARRAQSGEMSATEAAALREEPMLRGERLLAPSEEEREVRIRTRTSVLTLIVIAPGSETAERAMSTVAALAARHPSRAIIVSPGDPDGPSSFDAHIYAACQLAGAGTTEICTEEILIKTGGELSQHLATAVAPLLIHDLPVVLWWPDDVPYGTQQFAGLAEEADRLLVDSGQFRGDGAERLAGMRRAVRDGLVVHDIGWMRAMLWRELLAAIYDHPLLTPELGSVRSIRIDVARPGRTTRLARAASFVGWMAAVLGWSVTHPLVADGETYRGTLRHGRRDIEVELRPVATALDGSVRTAGSLVRVEVTSSHPRATTRVRVTRQADHLLATADWNGAQVARRAARLDVFDEMPFLAEALDRSGHDRWFEGALEKAVDLMATLAAQASAAPATAAGGRAGGPAVGGGSALGAGG
jgi:glucose-6-phosphate dehydrogenase assembly protein OpcA